MEVAKITLITSDLQAVPKPLKLSQKTVMGIRQNLFWAFIYNIIGIPVAAGGRLNPIWAAVAMVGSSLLVIANSVRLLRTPAEARNLNVD